MLQAYIATILAFYFFNLPKNSVRYQFYFFGVRKMRCEITCIKRSYPYEMIVFVSSFLWQSVYNWKSKYLVFQFSSVPQSCLTVCKPMNRSMPGLPVHHQLPESIQTHVHWVDDAIQPSHPLWSPSPPALNLSQHQGLFKWVSSSHQVAKVLKFQLQHQSFQWTPRTDLL